MDIQGHSSFVWSVIGAIAHTTKQIHLGTGVTCPIMRIHPAIIAQAAATAATMMPERFVLGVGSGENLNEHILGDHWPPAPVRLEMLEESVEIIRKLWEGKEISHYGKYYTVENARIYTLPDVLPPILIASSAENSAELAGRIGDGLISGSLLDEIMENFDSAGGKNKPRYGKLNVCWAASEEEGRKIVFNQWANTAIEGQLNQEIATPTLMEMAAAMVKEEEVVEHVICGPDANKHLEEIKKYAEAGFDHIYIHQIGPNQNGFFTFYEEEILPELNHSTFR
jgi:G6PDH family F420-dependent oxidoreductase